MLTHFFKAHANILLHSVFSFESPNNKFESLAEVKKVFPVGFQRICWSNNCIIKINRMKLSEFWIWEVRQQRIKLNVSSNIRFECLGASTQISFFASSGSSEIYRMNLFNTDYDVYSHSYLCFGQEQTRAIYQSQLVQDGNGSTIVDDPCLQPGYLQNVTFSALSGNPCVRGGFIPPNNLTNSMMIYFR